MKFLTPNKNLIISAQTASGKTEAAFLPILSQIVVESRGGISAIYVGPLKALINDQFERLEVLCKTAEIPVFKWHGDVGSDRKKKFLKNPSGVSYHAWNPSNHCLSITRMIFQIFLNLSHLLLLTRCIPLLEQKEEPISKVCCLGRCIKVKEM